MANVIGKKLDKNLVSTRNISPYVKSGTFIEQGHHFINEHKQ